MKFRLSACGTVYKKFEKEYEYQGKKGVSYGIHFSQGDEVDKFSVTKQVYDTIKPLVSYDFSGSIYLDSDHPKVTFDEILEILNPLESSHATFDSGTTPPTTTAPAGVPTPTNSSKK